jgi:mono/diheme cytochrome c family protein
MRESFIDFVVSIQGSAYAALLKVLVTGFFGSIILWGFPTAHAQGAEKTLVNKGEVLVKQNCSRCHAIGKEGNSPHSQAPPLRTLSRKYPIEDIAESLAEGIVSGHPDMPVFVFDPHDVAAIIQYLQSIQIEGP